MAAGVVYDYAMVQGMFKAGSFGDLTRPFAYRIIAKNMPILLENLILWRIASQQNYTQPLHNGLSVGFQKWNKLPVNKSPVPEGKTPPYDVMEQNLLMRTLQLFGRWVRLTKHIDLVGDAGFIEATTARQTHQASRTLDSLQWDTCLESNQKGYATSGTNYSMPNVDRTLGMSKGVTEAGEVSNTKLLDVVQRVLSGNDAVPLTKAIEAGPYISTVPVPEGFLVLGHTDLEQDMRSLPNFNAVETYAKQSNLFKGEKGKQGSFRFVTTTNATVYRGAGAAKGTLKLKATNDKIDVYPLIILGEDATAVVRLEDMKTVVPIVVKPKHTGGDIMAQHGGIAWLTFYAGANTEPLSLYVLFVACSSLE